MMVYTFAGCVPICLPYMIYSGKVNTYCYCCLSWGPNCLPIAEVTDFPYDSLVAASIKSPTKVFSFLSQGPGSRGRGLFRRAVPLTAGIRILRYQCCNFTIRRDWWPFFGCPSLLVITASCLSLNPNPKLYDSRFPERMTPLLIVSYSL